MEPIKYPRTYHFPFSKSLQNDDREIDTLEHFGGKEVVVTEKLDGEASTCYRDYFHPRSTIDDGHPSRDWLKAFKAQWDYLIPEGWRICGENMFAKHSIYYDDLESYFYCYNIWDENNYCLSYDETIKWCEYLGIYHVPVLYRGEFDMEKIREVFNGLDEEKQEGIVCRVADSFHYDNFDKFVAKAVRADHVQTDEHWTKNWTKNKLKK